MNSIDVTITLPALTTEQAIALWETLQQLSDAIWNVYGHEMGMVFARETLLGPPPDEDWGTDGDIDDDVPF